MYIKVFGLMVYFIIFYSKLSSHLLLNDKGHVAIKGITDNEKKSIYEIDRFMSVKILLLNCLANIEASYSIEQGYVRCVFASD